MTTSLKLSKLIAEMGIKVGTEKYWDSHAINKIQDGYGLTEDGEYPAFTLSDLPEVLKQIAKIKECNEFFLGLHFMFLVKTFYERGWEAMELELLQLITNL